MIDITISLIYGSSLNPHNNFIGNDNCGDKTMLSLNEMLKDSNSRFVILANILHCKDECGYPVAKIFQAEKRTNID